MTKKTAVPAVKKGLEFIEDANRKSIIEKICLDSFEDIEHEFLSFEEVEND